VIRLENLDQDELLPLKKLLKLYLFDIYNKTLLLLVIFMSISSLVHGRMITGILSELFLHF